MNFIKKNKWLFISLSVTLFILLVTFLLKGLYPFSNTVFNTIDFDVAYIPVYYKFWDIMHGSGTILFDWNLGAGLNCFGSLLMNGLLYPTSWLILLFNRNYIPYAMNILLIIKLLNMNLFAFIALDKLFPKLEGFYKAILSLFYTFSGWTLVMCGSLLYLDAVSLFPLFVYSFYNFIKNDKWISFVVILTLVLIISYYQAWMYLFFIIGATIITMLKIDVKNKKKKCVQILLMILSSLALSMITFLPAFYQVMTSYRITHAVGLNPTGLILFFTKLIHLLPLGIIITLASKQLLIKKDKKINIFFILLLVYTLIGLFVEPINKLWHTGSYSDLPFRYSYIPTFLLITVSAYYLTNNFKSSDKYNKKALISTICGSILFIAISLLFKDEIIVNQVSITIYSYVQPVALILLFITCIITTHLILLNDKKRLKYLLGTFSLISILFYTNLYINITKLHPSQVAQQVKDKFELKNDGYNYIENYRLDLGGNFPYILEVPSIQNWLHFIKEDEISFRNAFNYGSRKTMSIMSFGGNLFTNYITNGKYYLNYETKMNENLFKLLDYQMGIYYYESLYNGEFIIPYDGTIYNDNINFIENTNNVYKILYNKKDDVIHKEDVSEDKLYVTFKLKPGNIYYMEYISDDNRIIENHFGNDSKVIITEEYIMDPDNDLSYMSFYVTEEVELTFRYNYGNKILLGYINVDEFIDFASNVKKYDVKMNTDKNKRTYDITLDEEKSVLVPINYDDSFEVLVNGEKTDYVKNIYNMFSIDLKKGENKIEFIYHPKFIKEGILISLITLLVLIIITLLDKKIHFLDRKIILYPLFIITFLLGVAFILKVYILSWLTLLF